jgi:hypothetical protein
MKPRLTYNEKQQVDALDVLCDRHSLKRGVFSRGGKHGRYTIDLPEGKTTFLTISCTPRDLEFAIQRNEKNFRNNIPKVMGWTR